MLVSVERLRQGIEPAARRDRDGTSRSAQYSSGRRIVVAERSASVMTQSRSPRTVV